MRRSEWPGLAEWFEARWPAWSEETDEAFIQDLEPFTVPTILRAGKQLLATGERFLSPPLLVKTCRDIAVVDRDWADRQLPAPAGDELSWAEMTVVLGVPGMSFVEYVRKVAADEDE